MRPRQTGLVLAIAGVLAAGISAARTAPPVPAQQFRDDFESPGQLEHWRAWSNLHQAKMELA